MKYRIGLDIGIGSIGWAVISGEGENAKIEDFGTRIFDSGEKNNGKDRTSQERRGFRGTRRLVRRRQYRKVLLKNYFKDIGLINDTFEDEMVALKNSDVYQLKVKGLHDKLTPAELFKCLVHTCNHRGYKDFYEDDSNQDEEAGKNKEAVRKFDKMIAESGCKTVSEYLLKDFELRDSVEFRNRDSRTDYILIHRYLLEDEVKYILNKQQEYYPCLTDEKCRFIDTGIIFNQRDFEDGPGDKNDKFRRYMGFLESLGQCQYYPELSRGFRSTVIADVFAVVNTLSQYRYVNTQTGEVGLPKDLAKAIINQVLSTAKITMTDVKKMTKVMGYQLAKSENSDDKALSKAIKFLSVAKSAVDESGLIWSDLISEGQFDIEDFSKLHKIGEVVSKFQTPSRRKSELEKLGFLSADSVKAFSCKKVGGTAAASYKFMCESIQAFLDGDIFGNYQANFNKSKNDTVIERYHTLRLKDITDGDISNNPVVFKSINETRKIVNAIVGTYGSPDTIVVEVASDLNRSFEDRIEIMKSQKSNEKENDNVKLQISKLLGIGVEEVRGNQIDKYNLYNIQDGKSLYSGKPLGDITQILNDSNHAYEVDHIVPYSLILDNTLNNKALVFASENQTKGQTTPLMYLKGTDAEDFKTRVNEMYSRKGNSISKKKYKYLLLENTYNQDLLNEWKSRNINDTRYITKYIVGLFKSKLQFSTKKGNNVYGVKGSLTSKFRKIWLSNTTWGDEDKNRENYLNHALDAVVIANLTPAYVEIASDNIKLYSIYRKYGKKFSGEYDNYLESCIIKMSKYYHFDEKYSRYLLGNIKRVPAFLPDISREVMIRFDSKNEEELAESVKMFYAKNNSFIVKPHLPIASLKPERKFRGAIADSNPVKLVEIDGKKYKVKRKKISEITKKDLDLIYTNDTDLMRKLHSILDEKDEKYTIEKYLKENNLEKFTTDKGQPIFKVSLRDASSFSNYYKKEISDDNYSYLGMLKYYCIEVYEDKGGKTSTWGVRYIDIIKKNKKLYVKEGSLPSDYHKHIMYLFKNDLIEVKSKKTGELKGMYFYQSVKTITRSSFYLKDANNKNATEKAIGKSDYIIKRDIDILGRLGGEIKCSEPLSSIKEKE